MTKRQTVICCAFIAAASIFGIVYGLGTIDESFTELMGYIFRDGGFWIFGIPCSFFIEGIVLGYLITEKEKRQLEESYRETLIEAELYYARKYSREQETRKGESCGW